MSQTTRFSAAAHSLWRWNKVEQPTSGRRAGLTKSVTKAFFKICCAHWEQPGGRRKEEEEEKKD